MNQRLLLFFLFASAAARAQDTADEKSEKQFCSRKVVGQSPPKLFSLAFDYQGPSTLQIREYKGAAVSGTPQERIMSTYGPRISINAPVIYRPNIILSLGLNYWGTGYQSAAKGWAAEQLQDRWFHSLGVNATLFKPLNEKHFLIAQVIADHNTRGTDFNTQALTFSATALFGWKPQERLMWGLGATRTYRLGTLAYLPVLYYYQTFSPKWGVEAILPARAHVRYNLNQRSYLLGGYEAEGNQYFLSDASSTFTYNNNFLRRGEIRTRVIYEHLFTKNFCVSAQVGVRIKEGFNILANYNDDRDATLVKFALSPAPYAQVGLALVAP